MNRNILRSKIWFGIYEHMLQFRNRNIFSEGLLKCKSVETVNRLTFSRKAAGSILGKDTDYFD
jgi:hypothetical protein